MVWNYDHEYKVQVVKLAKEIGGAKAAKELGIPEGTLHTWLKAVRVGKLDNGEGSHTSASAMSLSEEITMLLKRVKDQIGLSYRLRRKPNGLTKADQETMKSDDLLKRDFHSDASLEKCITDITEIPASNGKLYVCAIFECFDLASLVRQWKQIWKQICVSKHWKTSWSRIPHWKKLSSTVIVEYNIPVSRPPPRPSGSVTSTKA